MYRLRNCIVLNLQIPARQAIESVLEIGLLTVDARACTRTVHRLAVSAPRLELRMRICPLRLPLNLYDLRSSITRAPHLHPLLLEKPLLVYTAMQEITWFYSVSLVSVIFS